MSREKEKVLPTVRERLKALPWLASARQKARHCVVREESSSPIVGFVVVAG